MGSMQSVTIKGKALPLPIIQGGMGVGVSLGRLAGHVALCGGMGIISTAHPGYRAADFYTNNLEANLRELKVEIKKAKEIASGKGLIGVNIMVALNHYTEQVKAAIEAGVDVIISGAGLPLDLPSLVKGTQVAIAPIVSSAKAAKVICQSWMKRHGVLPDFVVIEGCEAGGHLGFHQDELVSHTAPSLETILPEVLETMQGFDEQQGVKTPVFVAGGVYTGADIRRFIDMGAAGAQIATRFIATHECDADLAYKQAFLEAKPEDIVIVKSPVGMPGRALRSPLIDTLSRGEKIPVTKCTRCLRPCNPAETPYCITGALIAAVKGDWQNGLFFCGSNAYRMDELISVEELMNQLVMETED